jgi:hypothetical protein
LSMTSIIDDAGAEAGRTVISGTRRYVRFRARSR